MRLAVYEAVHHLAKAKYVQGRQAADGGAGREFACFVSVDLGDKEYAGAVVQS